MAGESPDKAEQQESSKETPAGGGGRDPRLSVLREPASPVPVDQPTAVFKTLSPRTPEDDAPSEPAEGDRLREAVAAWVASGDEPEDGGTEAPGAAATETAPGPRSDEREPSAADETAAPDDPEAVADADAPGADSAPAAGLAAADADVTPSAAPQGAGIVSDEASDTDAAPAADEASAGTVPDPVADEADRSGEDAADGDGTDAVGSADVSDGGTPAAAAAGANDSSQDASGARSGEPQTPADGPSVGTDARPAAREASVGTDTGTEPGSGARPAGESWFAARKTGGKEGDAVDQPTTVFKAVRPAVVDQPTTALKIPSLPKTPSAPEPDAARTSAFVPLRPDVHGKAPAPKAPAPKAPAAPTPVPPPPPSLTEAERTKQQPMPPLPPLDLLAELTNTPPPPPTPLRTTLRRVRIWTPLVVLLLIIFAVVQFVRPLPTPTLSLSAAPTFTFAGGELQMPWPTEGQGAAEVEGVGSLGTYGAQKPAPLASVAKTMTAYVILRDHPIKGNENGPEISIDKKAADEAGSKDESTAAVREGQTYTEKELLQLLMIPSGNNIARLLARWDAGSEAAFVEKMNAAAKDLGMTDSTYTDPSGLQSTTVSTPLDQLKLAKAVMQYDVFREIVNMPNLTVDGIPGRIENNNNILLEPGVSGIKTGSSTPAGGNLLWSANTVIDGKERRILGVVMGAKDAGLLHEKLQLSIDYSLKLIQQAQKDVTSAAVVRKGQVVGYVDDGLGGRTPVVADKELKAVGWPGLKVDLALADGGRAVPHSGKAGDIVGQVSIGTGAGKVSSPVSLQTDLVEPGFDRKLTRLG